MIDKRITARRNFKGGADMGTVSTPTRAATNKGAPNVSAGGASFNDLGPSISGRDTGGNQPSYERSRNRFIDKFNRDRTAALGRKYKPIGLDEFGYRPRGGGLGNLFKTILGFATGIPIGLFNKGKSGITNINNALGNFREKFTGYRTQQEYDDARQQRIDLNRINTIQNTLDRKYADGDYSMTDLDERLASLKEGLGITPNTAAQNEQQFLDFSNQPELSFEDIKKLAQPNINSSGINTLPMGIAPNNYNMRQPQYIEELDEKFKDPVKDQVGDLEFIMAGMNEAQKNKALQEMGFGVPADKIMPKLQQLDDTKFFMKTDDRIRAKEFIDFYEQNQGPLTDEQKMQIYVKAGEEFEEDA